VDPPQSPKSLAPLTYITITITITTTTTTTTTITITTTTTTIPITITITITIMKTCSVISRNVHDQMHFTIEGVSAKPC